MSGSRNRVAVMHGVNLDTLGRRHPEVYGTFNCRPARDQGASRGRPDLECEVTFWQTNHEGEFCETLHRRPRAGGRALVFEPGCVDALLLRHP